jgi:hypothetical protein
VQERDARVATIDPLADARLAAVMFPASAGELAALVRTLGRGWTVQDGRRVDRAAVVFARPCSIQTIAGLRRRFPDARIVVVESPIPGLSHLVGPIQRLLQAGADQFVTADGRRAA